MFVIGVSCLVLGVSFFMVPDGRNLSLGLSMVGQNTALATLAIGGALFLSGRASSDWVPRSLHVLALVLASLVLFQSFVGFYPEDGLIRVILNTLPSADAWPGRMSPVTALTILVLSVSALTLQTQRVTLIFVIGAGLGLVIALALASFVAHLTGLTLFQSVTPGAGSLSLPTSFLLLMSGLVIFHQLMANPVLVDWRADHPGQTVFVNVLAVLILLYVIALAGAGEFALQGRIGSALWVLVPCFLLGLLVIYRPIVRSINRSVASNAELLAKEAALEQAQAQAQLGSWRILLPGGGLEWSRECYRIFGLSTTESMDYEKFLAVVHPKDREFVAHSWRRALEGDEYDIQHRIVVNGAVKWVRERAQLELDTDNKIRYGVGTVQDITQTKVRESLLFESREQVRRLAAHNEDIREEERARIARELHDEMGQHLTVLRLDVSLIDMRFGDTNPELAAMLSDVKNGLDTSISVMRDVATRLRPLALDAGLRSAVDWLLRNFQERTGIKCSVIINGEDDRLDADRTTAAFRVLQESLTNVVRHANATELNVRVSITPTELILSVSDNGVGFDPASISVTGHFGLIGIRERVLIFGGATTIDSEPGRGTTLSVIIPIEMNNGAGEAE